MQFDNTAANFQPIQTPRTSFDYAQDGGGQGGWNPAQFSPFFDSQTGAPRDPGNAVTMSGGTFGGRPAPTTDPQLSRLNGGTSGFNPTFQTGLGGYNPSQYATVDTANQLATGLGGRVIQTQNQGPIQPPPQQMIDFGGDSPLNAGLLGERYAKYDRATADRMTRDELALQGPRPAMNEDSQGGAMGSWSMFGPSAGGATATLGGGSNLGSSVGSNQGWADHLAASGAVRQPAAPAAQPALGATAPPPVPTTPPAAPVAPPVASVAPPPTHTPVNQPAAPAAPANALPAPSPLPTNAQNGNQLMQLLQLLSGMNNQKREQTRQPYANSRYYPNLPRQSQGAATNPVANPQSNAVGQNYMSSTPPYPTTQPTQTSPFGSINSAGVGGSTSNQGWQPSGTQGGQSFQIPTGYTSPRPSGQISDTDYQNWLSSTGRTNLPQTPSYNQGPSPYSTNASSNPSQSLSPQMLMSLLLGF